MQNNQSIVQGSEAWLEAKQSKISASEIFSLVNHYCKPKLEAMGFDLKEEKSFRTIQEMFLKVKFGAKLSEIDPVHSEFGNGLEPYVAYRLGQELPQLKVERSKEFIVNEELHPLAACSPDGYIEIMNDSTLSDFDDKVRIDSSWGRGAMELKTANFFANFGSDKGSRLNYIFQLTFQMMVMNLKWGCLAVLMPKEKEYDEPFFKGKILEKVNFWEKYNHVLAPTAGAISDELNQYYDLKCYIYPQLQAFQQMIMKSLNAFQADLDNPDAYPRDSEDKAGIEREKKMLAQLFPEKFGTLALEPESNLDDLLNQRMIAQGAMLDAEKEMRNCEALLMVGTKKYTDIVGTKHRMAWTKNGQVRFYKINKKD